MPTLEKLNFHQTITTKIRTRQSLHEHTPKMANYPPLSINYRLTLIVRQRQRKNHDPFQ